jgi:hypothetical protein
MLLLSLLAFLVAWGMHVGVYRGLILMAEEGSLQFQTEVFLEGKVSRDAGDMAELVRYPDILTDAELGWISRYAPGHALWGVPGNAFGSPHVMSALAAALTVMAGYLLGIRFRMPRFLLPILMLLSPFFQFIHGSLLRESSAMAFSAWMLFAYVKGRQDKSNLSLFAAGILWSGLYLSHPVPAIWLGIPFAVDSLCVLYRNPKQHAVWRGLLLITVAVVVGVLLSKGYNNLVSGHTRVSPDEAYFGNESWGFGERRTQGGDVEAVDHSLKRGFTLMAKRVKSLDRWMLGAFPGFLAVWLALWGHGWNRRWSGLLLGTVLLVFVGYVGYWNDGISPMGPLHSTELLPFLFLGGGLGLSRIWRRMPDRRSQRLALFGAMLVICAYFSIPFWTERVLETRSRVQDTVVLISNMQEIEQPALLFLPDSLEEGSNAFLNLALNVQGLRNPVLRLQVREEDRTGVAAAFPKRTPYVLTGEGEVVPFTDRFEGLMRMASNSHRSRNTGSNVGEARTVDASLHESGFLFFGWYPYLPAGEYECRFDLRWSGVVENQPLHIEVVKDLGRTVIVRKVLSPGLEQTVVRFRLDALTRVEPRVYFGGSGTATLRSVDLVPVPLTPGELPADPVE